MYMCSRLLDRWGEILDSAVVITINANFDPLTCTATSAVLGSAGAASVFSDFPGAPVAGTWYSGALANKLAGFDLDPTTRPTTARSTTTPARRTPITTARATRATPPRLRD